VVSGLAGTPLASGAVAAFLLGILAAATWRTWPPIVSEAARRALLLALPVAGCVLALLRNEPIPTRVAAVTIGLAGLSLFSAEGSRANADAGWRRAVTWAGAILGPSLLVLGLVRWLETEPLRNHRPVTAVAAAAALLAWVPAAVVESLRVRQGLGEEVRLGLMPSDDARDLTFPWKRFREPRFGQRDERREYVRSALLLAVAHRQQTRRAGQAARLRQLEILAFRTRLRRTLEARASRLALGTADFPEDAG
jgi:hypothetical protein